MKLLSKLRRRKPASENATITVEQGRSIAEMAVETLFTEGGLEGFLVAAVSEPSGSVGEVVMSVKGRADGVTESVQRLLEILLKNPQTNRAAMVAIASALTSTGKLVEMDEDSSDDCDCPVCRLRRKVDEQCERTGKPH